MIWNNKAGSRKPLRRRYLQANLSVYARFRARDAAGFSAFVIGHQTDNAPKRKPPEGGYFFTVQCVWAISKSLTFFPELSCAVTQCGCLPRPDQVSEGRSGFRYFGYTFGYGRRVLWLRSLRAWSRAQRRSN